MRLATLTLALLAGGTVMMQAHGTMLQPADIRNVEVGGEAGRRIDVTIDNNLLVLDADGDFLAPFLKKEGTGGYVGLGKLIDAAVHFAAYSNAPKVRALKDHLVETILGAQEDDGYIGFFRPARRLWALWDIHEMAYIIYALTMDYRYFGTQASLDGAVAAADYIVTRWNAQPEREPGGGDITVYMAVTGLEPALLALYGATGEARFLDACTGLRALPAWDGPIVTGRWGPIQGHVYAYITRCLAQLRLNQIQPDPRLWKPTRRALDFMTRQHGWTIIGSCGQHECWHDTQEGVANLAETCATAYLMRWLNELLRIEGDAGYADRIERALFNALFAAQSPDGRRIRYYAPFEGKRVYFDGDTYCCPCNYRRIVAELPEMIYFTDDAGLVVSLYTASRAALALEDGLEVAIAQDTAYPSEGNVALRIEPERAAEFRVKLRIPAWCKTPSVRINGAVWEGELEPGSFAAITRTWRPGDEIALALPMPLRLVKGTRAQAGRVAVMRGPQLFTLNPARNPKVANENLRAVTLDPATLEGPFEDDSVRPGGRCCRVKAWRTTSWYPAAKHDFELTLTEYADPGARATYFHVPNPNDAVFVTDELVDAE